MTPYRSRQRGEGKIGCIVSLVVLVAALALGYKAVPVFYTDYALADFAGDLALKAGIVPPENLNAELRGKATDLGITEALADGAMTLTSNGVRTTGTCTITLKYNRVVDLYGFYPLTIATDKVIAKTYMDAR